MFAKYSPSYVLSFIEVRSFICRRESLLARVGPRANTDASGSIIGHRDAKGLVEMCGDELCQCGLLERMQVRQGNAVLLAGLSPWCQPQHVHLLIEGTIPDKTLAGTIVVTLQSTSWVEEYCTVVSRGRLSSCVEYGCNHLKIMPCHWTVGHSIKDRQGNSVVLPRNGVSMSDTEGRIPFQLQAYELALGPQGVQKRFLPVPKV